MISFIFVTSANSGCSRILASLDEDLGSGLFQCLPGKLKGPGEQGVISDLFLLHLFQYPLFDLGDGQSLEDVV